jgi:hypothetical protein
LDGAKVIRMVKEDAGEEKHGTEDIKVKITG